MTQIDSTTRLRRGFTLVEVLVVIGLISFLMVISIMVMANYITRAREEATAATILKIHKMYNQRLEAFQRSLKGAQYDAMIKAKVAQLQAAGGWGVNSKVAEILLRKDLARAAFPQRFTELADANSNNIPDIFESDPSYVSANHQIVTESAALLYRIIMKTEVYGIPPADTDEFKASEYADTDGDGLLEFIDAWGRPLRFYRWPTRLINPGGSTSYAALVPAAVKLKRQKYYRKTSDLSVKGLPNVPRSGNRDPLQQDPDDPLRLLTREMVRLPSLTTLAGTIVPPSIGMSVTEANYHTFDTYFGPLIVSPGADGYLGIHEPYEIPSMPGSPYGMLAQPTLGPDGKAGLPGVDDDGDGTVDNDTERGWPGSDEYDQMSDNITNRNRRAG